MLASSYCQTKNMLLLKTILFNTLNLVHQMFLDAHLAIVFFSSIICVFIIVISAIASCENLRNPRLIIKISDSPNSELVQQFSFGMPIPCRIGLDLQWNFENYFNF